MNLLKHPTNWHLLLMVDGAFIEFCLIKELVYSTFFVCNLSAVA